MKIAILGPTASGKSALALELALRLQATVVNGDPFQAYRGLAIGTGQPTLADQARAPHVGYGVLPLEQSVDPQSFGALVRDGLGRCPRSILVTGSGLYLRGIWQQLSDLPEVPSVLVEQARRWGDCLAPEALHRYLQAIDPTRAAHVHPRDRSRIQRALALHLATGLAPSQLLDGVGRGVPEGWRALLVLPDRESLRAGVARRVRSMMAAGWTAEVQSLVATGQEGALRRLNPLGYQDWLDGGAVEDIEARIIQKTQAYAKRQVTFFRNQWPEIPTWNPDEESLESALAKVMG